MRPLLIGIGGTLIALTGVLLLGPMLMLAVISTGTETAAGTCPASGGNPGGAFEVGYLAGASADDLTQAQLTNAATIVAVGEQLQIPARGIVIALATASQEGRFRNYANDGQGNDLKPDQRDVDRSLDLPHDAVGTDHGSVGIFQQQYPWWGTLEELMDPATSARKFYEALQAVPGWTDLPVTVAAQKVQRSAYPTAYADDEPLANILYAQFSGAGEHYDPAAGSGTCGATGGGGAVSTSGWALPLAAGSYTITSGYGPRRSPTGGSSNFHAGLDFGAPSGTPVYAVAEGTVTYAGYNSGGYGNLVVIATEPNLQTYYAHMVTGSISVSAGDTVAAGQQIGGVGTTGDSTGNHLHFEVRVDGATTDPLPFLQQQGLSP